MKKQKSMEWIIIILMFLYTKDQANDLFYKNIITITNPSDILVLVNKNRKLENNYVPNNLKKLDINYAYDDKYLVKEAAYQFEQLSSDALKEGYRIVAVSAYRDYAYQEKLFQHYVDTKGISYALACSAKAGHSEHQTGLAVDVMGENKDYNLFEDTKEFIWMQKHAHEYGFILRYPKGKENITGFKYEPWHYRYVGKKDAQNIYQENTTLDQYYFEKNGTNSI